jgi:hypothetical protein
MQNTGTRRAPAAGRQHRRTSRNIIRNIVARSAQHRRIIIGP